MVKPRVNKSPKEVYWVCPIVHLVDRSCARATASTWNASAMGFRAADPSWFRFSDGGWFSSLPANVKYTWGLETVGLVTSSIGIVHAFGAHIGAIWYDWKMGLLVGGSLQVGRGGDAEGIVCLRLLVSSLLAWQSSQAVEAGGFGCHGSFITIYIYICIYIYMYSYTYTYIYIYIV